jgi:hypothetical protein
MPAGQAVSAAEAAPGAPPCTPPSLPVPPGSPAGVVRRRPPPRRRPRANASELTSHPSGVAPLGATEMEGGPTSGSPVPGAVTSQEDRRPVSGRGSPPTSTATGSSRTRRSALWPSPAGCLLSDLVGRVRRSRAGTSPAPRRADLGAPSAVTRCIAPQQHPARSGETNCLRILPWPREGPIRVRALRPASPRPGLLSSPGRR